MRYTFLQFLIGIISLFLLVFPVSGQDRKPEADLTTRTIPKTIGPTAKPRLVISSLPSEAAVYVDGDYAGITPVQIETVVGKHRIEISKEGYATKNRNISVKSGNNNLEVLLSVLPRNLIVNIYRNDTIDIDGFFGMKLNGQETKRNTESGEEKASFFMRLPEGSYRVETFHTSGKYLSLSKELNIIEGGKYSEDFELQPTEEYQDYLSSVLFWKIRWLIPATGTILALRLTTLELFYWYYYDDYKEEREIHQIGTNLFMGAAVGFASLTALFLFDDPGDPPPNRAWQIQVQPEGKLGVGYSGRW
jgi:hypothetical protein